MQAYEMINDLDAKAGCLRHFTKFFEAATTSQLNAMRRVFKAYTQGLKEDLAENLDMARLVLPVMARTIATQRNEQRPEFLEAAERLGTSFFIFLMGRTRTEAAVEDIKRMSQVLEGKIEPAESLKNLHETLDDSERSDEDLAECLRALKGREKDPERIHMNLSLWSGSDDGQTSEGNVDLTEAEFLYLNAELGKLRGASEAVAPEPETDARSGIDVLENLYYQLKARHGEETPRFTIQLWENEESSARGVNISEDEFLAFAAILREPGEVNRAMVEDACRTLERFSKSALAGEREMANK